MIPSPLLPAPWITIESNVPHLPGMHRGPDPSHEITLNPQCIYDNYVQAREPSAPALCVAFGVWRRRKLDHV